MLSEQFKKNREDFIEKRNEQYRIDLEKKIKINEEEKQSAKITFENSLKKELTNKILSSVEDDFVKLEIYKEPFRLAYNNHLYELVKNWLINEGFYIHFEETLHESIKFKIGVK
jgi:predicted helicase